jgi:predicted membrane metal-binding protein
MRIGFLILLGLSVWRLTVWHKNIQTVEAVCVLQDQEIRSKKVRWTSVKIRAHRIESFGDELELQADEIYFKNRWEHLRGKIEIPSHPQEGILREQPVEIRGEFRCNELFLNFGRREDRPFGRVERTLKFKEGRFRIRPIFQKGSTLGWIGGGIRRKLKMLFHSFPSLYGLVWAVWTGETKGIDPKLVMLYREGGLLPVVALSGQHVSLFVFLLRGISRMFVRFFFQVNRIRNGYRFLEMTLPVLIGCLLASTSLAAPSILRTLAMALAIVILRMRRCVTSTAQVLSVSSALLLLFDPTFVTGVSFILSVGGTYLLIRALENISTSSWLKVYFQSAVAMSILSVPIVGFYFSRTSYLAPLCQLAANWLWTLLIIPIGFLIPIFGGVPYSLRVKVFFWLEEGVKKINEVQLKGWDEVHLSYVSILRPTWWEAALLTFGLIVLANFIFNFKKNKDFVN